MARRELRLVLLSLWTRARGLSGTSNFCGTLTGKLLVNGKMRQYRYNPEQNSFERVELRARVPTRLDASSLETEVAGLEDLAEAQLLLGADSKKEWCWRRGEWGLRTGKTSVSLRRKRNRTALQQTIFWQLESEQIGEFINL